MHGGEHVPSAGMACTFGAPALSVGRRLACARGANRNTTTQPRRGRRGERLAEGWLGHRSRHVCVAILEAGCHCERASHSRSLAMARPRVTAALHRAFACLRGAGETSAARRASLANSLFVGPKGCVGGRHPLIGPPGTRLFFEKRNKNKIKSINCGMKNDNCKTQLRLTFS